MDRGLDAVKTAFKQVAHRAVEFVGSKIEDAVTKSTNDNIVKQEPVEWIIIPPEKGDEIFKKLRKSL